MPRTPGTKDVSPATRAAIAMYLAERSMSGRLLHGSMAAAAAQFSVSRYTVAAVWKARHDAAALLAPRRPRPTGVGRRMSDQEVAERVQAVPLCQRQSLRALESATGIPKSTLHTYLSSKILRRFISRVKPTLTPVHKRKRLAFALSHVQHPIGGRFYRMHHMYDVVHIDEKWFNLYRASTKYYLASDEQLPYRSSPNKRYIGKVMVLAAVARPRYDSKSRSFFDGKIGIWPVVERSTAIRSSNNRPAGSQITKCISMTREIYVKMLQEKVFPAIRQKWPGRKSIPIKIQQDNAGPHVPVDHADIVNAGRIDGWRIRMICQPPRSPDFNILDLGFFNSIQSLQYQKPTTEIDGLITAVSDAFNEVSYKTLDKCFITLQKVMETTIKHGGDNDFKLPRVKKIYLRGNVTPSSIAVDSAIVEQGEKLLSELLE